MTVSRSVYIFKRASGARKIGMSTNPERRMLALGSCRAPLSLIAAYPRAAGDARTVERVAHKLLHEKRLGGEWFDVTDKQAIAAVKKAIVLVDSGDLSTITTNRTRLDVHPTEELLGRIDDWRRTLPGLPNRAAAARHLIERGLEAVELSQPSAAPMRAKSARARKRA